MIVCVTYRPPNCPVICIRDELKPKFIEALLLGKEIIILGDMNFLKTSCYESKILLDTCSELHLTQLIKDPTRTSIQNTRRSVLSYLKREAQPSILDMIKHEFECFE
jgi:hypothetical protein